MAQNKPKREPSKEEEFVQDMLRRAQEKAEPTQPNQVNEDPEEISEILSAIKKRQATGRQ